MTMTMDERRWIEYKAKWEMLSRLSHVALNNNEWLRIILLEKIKDHYFASMSAIAGRSDARYKRATA